MRETRLHRVRSTAAARGRVVADDISPILQATAAATTAWWIARWLGDHPDPFFAPIAALVALNASFGERGLNAVRLLQGVILGIGVGELTLLVLGGGYGSVALGTFVALVLAQAVGGVRIVRAQAAIGAILTIASADGHVGVDRLLDALIGAAVALVFSQFLFSPQPLRLLREVESDALAAMAAGLDLTARALEGDEALAEQAIADQRGLRDQLSELARMRRASARVARHSVVWRGQIAPVVRETEDIGHLDLLGSSCLLLTRTSLGAAADDRRLIAPCVRDLAALLAVLAEQPGERATRQRAVDGSLEFLRGMRTLRDAPDPELTAALAAARIAVTDLMLFVGVDPEEARAAIRAEAREPLEQELSVPAVHAARERRIPPLARWLGSAWHVVRGLRRA